MQISLILINLEVRVKRHEMQKAISLTPHMSEAGSDLDGVFGLLATGIGKVVVLIVCDEEELIFAILDQACHLAWTDNRTRVAPRDEIE